MKKLKSILLVFAIMLSLNSFGQEKVITGIISDNIGRVPGVMIVIKGTNIKTQSDLYGAYEIKVKFGDTLVFSFCGCNTIERITDSSNIINVTLQESKNYFCDFGMTAENADVWQNYYTPKFYPINKDKITTFDLENNFKNDVKNKSLKIYVLDEKSEGISEIEFNFQNKYKVEFLTYDIKTQDYFENYNKKLFDFLEDNFNNKWQNEINSEILGFEKWQNN